jgi:Ca2+-transporting ATPase
MHPPVWHAIPADTALAALESGPDGLDAHEAAHRLARSGANALLVAEPLPAWKILLSQAKSLVVLLLVAALGLSLLLGDLLDAVAIASVLIVNAAIGFWVEWRARNAMAALRAVEVARATVVRGGKPAGIDARNVVPGDVILLEAGEAIPADARLLSNNELRVIEAPLTGEPAPVAKRCEPVGDPDDPAATPLADRRSMVYKGTLAAAGTARAVVVGTGRDTEIGRITELVQATEAEDTPLEVRLGVLGRRLVWITLGVALMVTALGVARGGDPWLMLETGIALAIAAVPEGLPVVATITLALGMRRMATRHALVRSLPAVETLGSATVVCADKTGTLTGGRMVVTCLEIADSRIGVTGADPDTEGGFTLGDRAIEPGTAPGLEMAARIAVLANRARLTPGGDESAVRIRVDGDPTEGALLVFGRKAGLDRDELLRSYPELGEVPFASERRMMATFHQDPDGRRWVYAKGAPGKLLRHARTRLTADGPVPLDDGTRATLLERNRELARDGLRVLGLAFGELPPEAEPGEEALSELTFLGFVGIEDPPAPKVRETIQTLGEAGVRTVMITGDQAVTAAAIGRQLGLPADHDRMLEGTELTSLDDDELDRRLERIAIFSRIEPADKLRIVEAFQRRGDIVAMLGDGVNDAPALKRANIGVAMGGRGTDVAKETAGLVLQDDRFETIGIAVEEGRVVFDNIRKFVFYLFSCNLSEVLVILLAGLVGLPMPLLPLQILWLNLVTDVFPALALAVEPPEEDVMDRPPRSPDAAILSRPFVRLIAGYGVVITASTLSAFAIALRGDGGLGRATTVAFMTLALSQLFHVFNARAVGPIALTRRFFRNRWVWSALALTVGLQLMATYLPALSRVLRTEPLSLADWSMLVPISLIPLALGQAWKAARGRRVAPP